MAMRDLSGTVIDVFEFSSPLDGDLTVKEVEQAKVWLAERGMPTKCLEWNLPIEPEWSYVYIVEFLSSGEMRRAPVANSSQRLAIGSAIELLFNPRNPDKVYAGTRAQFLRLMRRHLITALIFFLIGGFVLYWKLSR